MLLLIAAFILLALAFRRVLRPPSSSSSSGNGKSEGKKSSAHTKLLQEAFEHTHETDESGETGDTGDTGTGDGAGKKKTQRVLILYATEYGFASQVARKVAEHLSKPQLSTTDTTTTTDDDIRLIPRVVNVLHYGIIDFTRERYIAFVCSTTGDGVPPNEASVFRDALTSTDVILPSASRFAIMALGDKAYPHFCRAGAVFDALLPSACRLLARTDVDKEDWDVINNWTKSLHAEILRDCRQRPQHSDSDVGPDYLHTAIDKYAASLSTAEAQYTRNNPFHARLVRRRRLTAPVLKPGHKEVVRLDLDITGSNMQYTVGDALAIIPRNNPAHVNRLLRTVAANGDEIVRLSPDDEKAGGGVEFETALTELLDIKTAAPGLIYFLCRHAATAAEVAHGREILGYDARDPANRNRMSVSEFGKAYLAEREVFEVLMDFATATVTPQQLTNVLRPLHARYYSISSTPAHGANSVSVTVDVLRYNQLSLPREGVASCYVTDRCRPGNDSMPIFLSRNPNFRLPASRTTPIIMIGPGTGVAPFVAFIAERAQQQQLQQAACGAMWLFFGCRFSAQDFLYKEELQHYASTGVLSLHTAFSRDGPQKTYVQQRMLEQKEELWAMIDGGGAHVYVCGDGGKMAIDVDKALRDIVAQCGDRSDEDAASYLEQLANEKRYQRDVWVS